MDILKLRYISFYLKLNGPEYWRFSPRKYTESYQQNHLLCDTKFRPSDPDELVLENDEQKDELDEINQKTPKSYFGLSTLF